LPWALLRTVLHQRSIRSFDLPAARSFPLELEITWLSRFSADGIRAIRNESRDQQWDGLVKALEIAETERYASGSFRRDWITYESVRDVIDLNPVQAHLASIYPIKGRSSFQRRQVVSAYFRARRFLRLVECWGADEPARILDSLSLGWDVPVFIWFHLLCPAAQRTSALVVRGDLERVWGNTDLV